MALHVPQPEGSDPFTLAPPAVPRTEYERVCRELDRWRARAERAEAKLRWEDELFASDQLQAGDKLTARALYAIAQHTQPTSERHPVLNMAIAERTGRSAGSVGDSMKRLDAAGAIEYEVRYDRTTGKDRAAFAPTPAFLRPASITSPKPKNGHGGARVQPCTHCPPDTPIVEKRTMKRQYICQGCGEVLQEETEQLPDRLLEPVPEELPGESRRECRVADSTASQVDQPTHMGGEGKAESPAVDDAGPPAELQAKPQWVAHDSAKVPYNPRTGREAKPGRMETCGTYADALAAVHRSGLAGTGYMFNGHETGVDLDHCRNPDTGAIERWALDIITELQGYAEVSPSGTGVHVIVRGSLPEGRRKRGSIEMYDRGRYFTVTGRHLAGTPTVLEDRTAELAVLHARVLAEPSRESRPRPQQPAYGTDAEILSRARSGKRGETFERLWWGDWSGYASQSEADLSLCGSLAAYGADAGAIDRLFRQSGLFRPEKWDQRHAGDGRTYGEMTIDRVMQHA